MPLLDHFHPPLSVGRPWTVLHGGIANSLAAVLNNSLEQGYAAVELSGAGPGGVEMPVHDSPSVPGLPSPLTLPIVFADEFGAEVVTAHGARRTVAVIELVTPRQKATPEARRAFAAHCAGILHRGLSLILMDFVTSFRGNLHNEMMQVLNASAAFLMPPTKSLYAVAYRAARRQKREEIEIWPVQLSLGETLPTLPLALDGDSGLMLDLEIAYMHFWRQRKSMY